MDVAVGAQKAVGTLQAPITPPSSTKAPHGGLEPPMILGAMILVYAVIFTVVCVVKYRYYLYRDFDLAIFTQAVAGLLRGSFVSSIRGMNWLGDHSSLVLFLVTPLYAVARSPVTLLVLQTLALALGAVPVYRIARRELNTDGAALGFAALYLLHPALGFTNLYEFHPETLATPLVLWTLDGVLAGRFRSAVIAATLALTCREDVALLVAMLAVYALVARRPASRPIAAALLALSVASLALTFAVLRPLNRGQADYLAMYQAWGNDARHVVTGVLRKPHLALAHLFWTPNDPNETMIKRQYYVLMLAPLGFLSLLSPALLTVLLPILLEHFLSSRTAQHEIVYQYTALVTPVLVVCAVLGLRRLVPLFPERMDSSRHRRRGTGARSRGQQTSVPDSRTAALRPRVVNAVTLATIAASVACNWSYGSLIARHRPVSAPLPEANAPDSLDRTMKPWRDRMLAQVPKTGGVVTGFEFLAHLANRPVVHSAHHLFRGTYTYSERAYEVRDSISALLIDPSEAALSGYLRLATSTRLQELIRQNHLVPEDGVGDLVLLTRGATAERRLVRFGACDSTGPPQHVVFDGVLAFLGSTPLDASVSPGQPVPIRTCWQRLARVDHAYMMVQVLTDASGRIVHRHFRHFGYAIWGVSEWPSDEPVTEDYAFLVPADLSPGEYKLSVKIAWIAGDTFGFSVADDPQVHALHDYLVLGTIRVNPRS